MRYRIFLPEKPNYCVPSCVQSILERRKLPMPSQEEIFAKLKKDGNGVVMESIDNVVSQYGLKVSYAHKQLSIAEIDFVVEEALKENADIIAAFRYDLLFEKEKEIRHASLVDSFSYPDITLLDLGTVNFSSLLQAMPLDGCGFYLLNSC